MTNHPAAIEPERYEFFERPAHRFEPDRRAFFKVTGAGLIVLLLLDRELDAQRETGGGRRRGFGGPSAPDVAAWLHIAADGQVTAYTGKVELGQNIRTSLAQAVADELRVPLASVRLVMADTARTPFDMGTFGSLSTPMMASQLRRASAAAREKLIDLAAERFHAERARLTAADGKVTDATSGKSVAFGELTQGRKLLQTVSRDTPVTPASQWKEAGVSVPKVDARAIVTGSHRYASDVSLPGMLRGKVLRPPAFHATLESLDTKAAEAMPGVAVVRDGNFVGVTAANEYAAEQALAAVKADWKAPPQVSGKDVYDHLRKRVPQSPERRSRPSGQTTGSIDKGLAEADRKLEATYTVAYIAHAPLEPRAAVAQWQRDKLTVWTGTQRPFGVQQELVDAFQVPAARVRVIVPDTGSGYGGKHTGEAAVEAARLARAAGKPVKVVWTREEEFTWAYFRPAGVIDVKSGARKDGTLTAWEFHNYNSGGAGIRSPYAAPHQHVEFHPADSPLRQGSYRALAATANHFARETHMDELAHALGAEPLEFRLKNLKDARLRAVLEAAAKQFGWGKKPAARHGVGIAAGFEKNGYVATCAEVALDRSRGRVEVVRLATAFDCGAVVNPDHLKNQIEGAAVMGLGGALFEAVHFANGTILNPRFSAYRVPRFADAPAVEVVLVNRKDVAPAGAGETPIVTVAPAVGNAIFDAAGARLRSLPMLRDGLRL